MFLTFFNVFFFNLGQFCNKSLVEQQSLFPRTGDEFFCLAIQIQLYLLTCFNSRTYPYAVPTPRKVIEITIWGGGGGVSKPAKLEFPGEWGVRVMDIFWKHSGILTCLGIRVNSENKSCICSGLKPLFSLCLLPSKNTLLLELFGHPQDRDLLSL